MVKEYLKNLKWGTRLIFYILISMITSIIILGIPMFMTFLFVMGDFLMLAICLMMWILLLPLAKFFIEKVLDEP